MAGDNSEVFEAIATKELLVGDLTVPIRMKKLTGTTGATENDTTTISHGLTLSKIISWTIMVEDDNGNLVKEGYTDSAGEEYYAFITSTNVTLELHATNSENILSDAITVLIIYEA